MTKTRWIFVLSMPSLLALLVACVATWYLNFPTGRIVQQWNQPKVENPYMLSVVEGSIDWTDISFPRRHYLFVGQDHHHGYHLDYSFHPGLEDVDAYIARSTVEWSDEGVAFVEASGQRLFIPKAVFK